MAYNGILIDYEWCSGCHACEIACQMDKGLPEGQWGIKVFPVGPWQYGDGKWQYAYMPVPTDQCDLCAERVEAGKKPMCVHHCQAMVMTYGPVDELAAKLSEKPSQVLFVPKQ